MVAVTFPLVVLPEAGTYVIVEAVGATLSIRVTVAKVDHVFPALSLKLKVKLPVFVNVYVVHVLFVTVIASIYPVRVAVTFPLVHVHELGL
jgi:hypothetical protein